MLSEDQITHNKEQFISLLRSVTREGSNIEGLINKLCSSDFFTAPASTKYHGAFKGGLCRHCLDVYIVLKNMVMANNLDINEESLIICALMHDFSKMNLYESTYTNKKVYSESGSKSDNAGRFDWVSEPGYKTVSVDERFVYGNHEETSEFMIRQFIPLNVEESVAILYHHGGMGYDSTKADISLIYSRYPLALMLHLADMTCAYLYC